MKNLAFFAISFALFLSCNLLEKKNSLRFILQINTRELLEELAGQNRFTPDFALAVASTDSLHRIHKNKKYSDLFFQILDSKKIPVSKFYGDSRSSIEQYLEKAKTTTRDVLQKRLEFDQVKALVVLIPNTDLIKVEVRPDEDGSFSKTQRLITLKGNMSFRYVQPPEEIYTSLIEANKYLVKKIPIVTVEEDLSVEEPATDSVTAEVSPLFSLLKTQNSLIYSIKDQEQIDQLINLPEVKALFPQTEFIWMKPFGKDTLTELVPAKIPSSPMEILSGNRITKADVYLDKEMIEISFSFDKSGSEQWKEMTRKASEANPKKRIAIILDGVCLMAPTVQGEIPNGNCSLTGDFTLEEAQAIARMMESGSCPASLVIVEQQNIK